MLVLCESKSPNLLVLYLGLDFTVLSSKTKLALYNMVGHLFQNYDTIYVRFFATHNCHLSCSVGFFPKYICVYFLFMRSFHANIRLTNTYIYIYIYI